MSEQETQEQRFVNLMVAGNKPTHFYFEIGNRRTQPGKTTTVTVAFPENKVLKVGDRIAVEQMVGDVVSVVEQRPSKIKTENLVFQKVEINVTTNELLG